MVFTPEATRSLLPEVLLSIGVPEDQVFFSLLFNS